MDKEIIDCHRHLYTGGQNKTFEESAKDLILDMKKNGISKSVVIADNVVGSDTADIEELLKVFQDNHEILLIGAINLLDQSEDRLGKIEHLIIEHLIKEGQIIALKLYNGHDKVYLTDKRCFSTYEICDRYEVPLMIHTGINSDDLESAQYNDPKMIVEIAKKFPKLKIIISHLFWPKIEYCYKITRGVKNIYFDTSALADDEVIEMSGGLKKIKNVLTQIILERDNSIVFGTDYPMCKTDSHINLVQSMSISEELKNKIFSGNFKNLFYNKRSQFSLVA